jgi:hypothetical protein
LNTEEVVEHLKAERDRLDAVIAVLDGSRRVGQQGSRGHRRMSADARRKISEAQKRRWAQRKRSGKTGNKVQELSTATRKPQSGMSASGRRRLSEMMKKRWLERRKKAA